MMKKYPSSAIKVEEKNSKPGKPKPPTANI